MPQGYEQFRNLQGMYLNSADADVWFLIDGKRIPCHMSVIRRMPYFESMLAHPWYNNDTNEVNLGAYQGLAPEDRISASSFKEFLKFIYGHERNFTEHNIYGVVHMANSTESYDLFRECEAYLRNSITKTNLYERYSFANRAHMYPMDSLKKDIFAHIDCVLKLKHFEQIPYEFLQDILVNDALACEEKELFDGCIAWAKAKCRENGVPRTAGNVRNQLNNTNDARNNLLYQIRFTAMTSKEAAVCVKSNPGLFSSGEIEEILCMVGHNESFQSRKFNWNLRRFHLNWDRDRLLECSRFSCGDKGRKKTLVKDRYQITRFTCNKRVVLKGFKIELSRRISDPRLKSIRIQINEINSDGHTVERFARNDVTAAFLNSRSGAKYNSFTEDIQLNGDHVLLRPNYTYEIRITFLNYDHTIDDFNSQATLNKKVRVDHDVVFSFKERGIVASLSFRRFDDRKLLQKIIHNPKFWIWILVVSMILGYGISPFSLYFLYIKISPIVITVAWYTLYVLGTVLALVCCILCGAASSNDSDDNVDRNSNAEIERLLQEIVDQHQYIDDEP